MSQLLPQTDQTSSTSIQKTDWHRGLEGIICSSDHGQMDTEACGVYELEILETQAGTEIFYIDISSTGRSVSKAASKGRRSDVSVSLTSSDLAAVLQGTLSPLQGYLTGRITANGEV